MLILASNSPRRKILLKAVEIPFRVIVPDIRELSVSECLPESLPILNARLKSESVAERHPDSLVLGADTVVELDGKIIEKPRDEEDALRMLCTLSGREHQVVTGVCLTRRSDSLSVVFAEKSKVIFRDFSRETAVEYLKKVHVLDKAGAYAVQEYGYMIIKEIKGSVSNVIGLPVETLSETLEKVCL